MKRLWIAMVLTLSACNQNKAEKASLASTAQAESATSAQVQAAGLAVPAVSAAVAAQSSRFTGTLTAQAKKSTTTKKEGAPQGWEKDDGKAFSGEGKITLNVAADGTVQGTLTGALGDRTLRGVLSGDDLRAALVPAGSDVTQIQNGTLTLKREGSGFKGTLTAATGDALILREASVQLTPSAS